MTLVKTITPILPVKIRYVYKEREGLNLTFALLFWILLGIFIISGYGTLEIHFPILKLRIIGGLIALIWALIPQMTIIIICILQDLRIINSFRDNIDIEFL